MLSENITQGLARIGAAYAGKADRVPVIAQIGAHTLRLAGQSVEEFFGDPDRFVKTHLAVTDYYRLDAPSFYYDLYNIEAEALGQELTWLPGMFPEIKAGKMLIESADDLDRLKPPDPRRDGRMPFIIEFYKRVVELGIKPQLRFCAPFSLAGNVRGLSNIIIDVMTKPDFAHRLFRFLTDDVLAPWIDVLRQECGADLTAVGADALASLPVTNLKILEEYGLGYILRLRELIGNVEVRGWWGEMYAPDPRDLLEIKWQGHPSCVQVMDPDVHAVGPEVFKAFADEKDAPLLLGIDCALLSRGPVEAIAERVRDYIRVGAAGNRFILFLNEVGPDCPPDHVHAAVQAAHQYGTAGADLDQPFVYKPRRPFGA